MINKSLKYIGVLLLAYTLNACNEQRMKFLSETTTPVWLSEVGKRDIRELTTTTGTAKAAKTVEVKSRQTVIRTDDQSQDQASLQAGRHCRGRSRDYQVEQQGTRKYRIVANEKDAG
ncbi:MAG: hypothetical protein ACLTZT_14795 [Butyricimonas faecalis]